MITTMCITANEQSCLVIVSCNEENARRYKPEISFPNRLTGSFIFRMSQTVNGVVLERLAVKIRFESDGNHWQQDNSASA